ncbi:MAG: cytochrome c [Ancalomicrobiaceae bacterium]|nr:cytochrome c [Ancalomicrobiaceae bacterium]
MRKLVISVAALSLLASVQSSSAEDLKAGADLFNDNCAICHGSKGQGYAKEVVPNGAVLIKKLAGDSAYWDFAVFKKAVLEGKDDENRSMKVMPVFGKAGLFEPPGKMLADADLKNIQAYMKSFGPKQ